MYRANRRLVLVVVAGVVAIASIFSFRQPIANQMHAWKLLPNPERLTELYFTQPNNLPASYQPNTNQTVNFTVHNLEYQPTKYQYQIVETNEDGSNSQVLSTGDLNLAHNQYANPSVNITTADLGPRVKIVVQLANNNESIGYWLKQEVI